MLTEGKSKGPLPQAQQRGLWSSEASPSPEHVNLHEEQGLYMCLHVPLPQPPRGGETPLPSFQETGVQGRSGCSLLASCESPQFPRGGDPWKGLYNVAGKGLPWWHSSQLDAQLDAGKTGWSCQLLSSHSSLGQPKAPETTLL